MKKISPLIVFCLTLTIPVWSARAAIADLPVAQNYAEMSVEEVPLNQVQPASFAISEHPPVVVDSQMIDYFTKGSDESHVSLADFENDLQDAMLAPSQERSESDKKSKVLLGAGIIIAAGVLTALILLLAGAGGGGSGSGGGGNSGSGSGSGGGFGGAPTGSFFVPPAGGVVFIETGDSNGGSDGNGNNNADSNIGFNSDIIQTDSTSPSSTNPAIPEPSTFLLAGLGLLLPYLNLRKKAQ